MKLTHLLGATAVGLSLAVGAAAAGEKPAGVPQIRFASLVHDFGRLDVGAVVQHEFVFTNIGTAPLEIRNVHPGCGCTTAGTWDRVVQPGATGRIPLQFNSTSFNGPVSKSATVTCNDPGQSNVFLQIKANVWRPVTFTPQSLYFNVSAESPTNETRTVRIVSNLDQPLKLSEPVSTNKAFRVELRPVTEGKEYELRVTTQPPFTGTFVQSQITLQTSVTNPATLSIPAYASVQPAVSVVPPQIVLPTGPVQPGYQPSVTIRNAGTNALTLSEPAINLPGATVALNPVQPGKLFTLQLTVPPGVQLQSTQRVAVTLKTSHPNHATLNIPVIQPRSAASGIRPAGAPAGAPAIVPRAQPAQLRPPPMLARPPEAPPAPPTAPLQ